VLNKAQAAASGICSVAYASTVGVSASAIYLARALRPVLANAPRTDERIRVAEQLAKIAVSGPGWVFAFALVGGLAAMSLSIVQMFDDFRAALLARSAPANAPLLIVGGLMIAYIVYLVRLRAKSKRTQIA
jgi:hypothetical protein